MKLTQQTRLRMALESRGSRVILVKRKYLVLSRTDAASAGETRFYYLGNAGSLRTGRSYTHSVPVADRLKAELLAQVPATVAKVGKCRIIRVEL